MNMKKAANAAVKKMDDKDAMRLAGMAQVLRQQRDAKQAANPAAPASAPAKQQGFQSMATSALKNLQHQLNQTPGLKQRVESAQPTAQTMAYPDFNSAQEVYDYLVKNTAENEKGNAVSQKLDAYLNGTGWYNTAEEMERINAQYSPEDAVYSPEQIASTRLYERLGDQYLKDLDALYTQRIGEEERIRQSNAIKEYESVRNRADYAQRVAQGGSDADADWDAYFNSRRKEFSANYSPADIHKQLSKDFEKELTNPAEWAAANAAELLAIDENQLFLNDASLRQRGLANPLYLYMSDEQRDVYSYYIAAEGREKADAYFKSIEKSLRELRNERQYQSYSEWAADHPGAAFGARMINQLGTVQAVPETIQQTINNSKLFGDGIDRPLDTSVGAFGANRRSAAFTEGISSNVDSRIGQFLLNVGFSLSDNAVAGAVGLLLGPWASAALLAGESASAAMYEAGERGLSASDAAKAGIVTGGWEYLTEKIAFDELFDMVKASPKSMTAKKLLNILKQSGVEASEEYANSLLSTMTERAILGGDSSYDQYVRDMQAQGASYEEAVKAADLQFYWLQPFESAAAGFVSGGVMGAGGTVISDITNRNQPQMTNAQRMAAATMAGIFQRENDGTATIADTVAEKVLTGQNPSNSEIRQLQNATTTIQRSFEGMTGIEVVGVDSSNLRASIAAAVKTPAITIEQAAQYADAVAQAQAAAPAPQYDSLRYNAPDASAIGAIDAARQGGAPLEVATAQDEGSAADMADDFRQRQAAQRKPTEASAEVMDRLKEWINDIDDYASEDMIEDAMEYPPYLIDLLQGVTRDADGSLWDTLSDAQVNELAEYMRGVRSGEITPFSSAEDAWRERAAKRAERGSREWKNFIRRKSTSVSDYLGLSASEASELREILRKAGAVNDRETMDEIYDYIEDINYENVFEDLAEEDTKAAARSRTQSRRTRQRQAAPRITGASAETDAAGNPLSAAQAEYFKDSKIRGREGKLIPMYHGSPSDFTVFDIGKSRNGYLSFGFYFTSNREYAEEYQYKKDGNGGKMVKSYLNITNPCIAEAPIDKARWAQVYERVGLDSSWLDSVSEKADNSFATYHLKTVDGAEQVTPEMWREAMKSVGWDGWISNGADGLMAVAFDSAQIKRTDNLNPTDDPDIRFRLTGDQYDASALFDALEYETLSDAHLANLTAQLRERLGDKYTFSDAPDAQELLGAVEALDTMDPGFILNITKEVYKTAEQKAAEQKAAREKAAADRAERKRLAEEERQRKAEAAEQERKRKAAEAEEKKAAAAERRAKAAQKRATAEAARTERQTQSSITKAAKENIVSTERIKGDSKNGNSVQIVNVDGIIRSLDGNARAEFERAVDSVREFGRAFGHRVRFFTGRMTNVNGNVFGFYHNGEIYVNVDDLRAAGLKTVAHEVCHDIAANNPSFVSTFYRLYREYCESNGLMNEFSRRWNDVYNNSIYPNKQLAIAEEVLAEMFGERAEGDSEFLNYCLGKRPGIITRIVESLNRILVKLHLKKYSKASADAMELRNFLLGTAARYQMSQTGRGMKLSAGIRSDYRSALRKSEAIGDRYAILDDLGVNLAEWDTTGLAAPAEYRNLNRKAPDEVTNYGFKLVVANRKANRVLIVNPFRYVPDKGVHADMVASSRSLAAALGLRLGFISGKTSETVGEGKNRRDIVTDMDFLLADDGGTVFINLDSEIPYPKIVAGAWWSQFRKTNPAAAANLERLSERVNKLTGGDSIAQNYAVDLLTRKGSSGIKALAMDPETLVKKLTDSKSAAYAFTHEKPGIMRKLFENAGDMVAKLTKKQDYRAAYISGQLQARLMKAFSETSPNRPGGNKIETVKRKKAPEGVWFMSSGDKQQNKLLMYDDDLRIILASNPNNVIIENEEQIREYVEEAFADSQSKKSLYFGMVPIEVMDNIRADISNISDEKRSKIFKDGREYSIEIGQEDIRHIKKKSMSIDDVVEYVTKLPEIILQYDTVHYSEYKQGSNILNALRFKRRLEDGTYIALEVASRKRNSFETHNIFIDSSDYKKRKSTPTAYVADATQAQTSKTRRSSTSVSTIPHLTDEVKFSARRDNNAVLREPTRTDPVDTYKRRDLRSKISKEVKALSAALTSPSDKKHIPPKLTSAIADFLKEFTNDTSVFTAAKLAVLRDAYDRLSDTGVDSDMDVSYAYDPDISETISELSDTIDGRRLAQLNMDETVKVRNIVRHFKHLVTAENKLFLEGRKRDVAALGSDIMTELRQRPAARTKADQGTFKAFTDMLTSGNITPAYFFKRIGGTMESLFKSMRSGQNVWATNMRQAQQTYESIFKKRHADKWLNKRNDTLTFTTERGDNITLTRQQALTLYATHQREVTNQIQEAGHLSLGGFVYEDAVKTKRGEESVDTTKAHPLNANDMRHIIDWLTDEQIKFADELVGYMSGDLAKLGNETSLKLHGWEKFTESYYFPYNSAENYLYTKQAVTEDRRLKHMSFTKSTVRKANNPIVLSDFTQVWANHVQNMLMYSSLAVPLEDFNRVYNYKTSVTEDSTSRSVKEALEKAYGKNANAYIKQLMTDINGGVTPPRSEGFFNRMMSKFRKSAVFASASVVVQQPSAIGRAMAMINPKYFVASTFQRKNWEECKRWCGVALIKEMGRFDTSTGRGAADWLIAQPYRGVQKVGAFFADGDFRDDVLSAPAAKADAYTWSAIWNACKREAVREKGLQPNSKELFKAAAERFDEVINFTQVYDSVFARSELMRSKSGLTKAMTAFMSEPTVTYNMLLDSVVNVRRKDVKNKVNPARAVGAFVLSATINAVLKSLVTALREEDEDKTYIEKYLGELVENFESDTNLLSLIPYVRDLLSLVKGYSVENTAYDVPKDFIEAGGDILKWIEANITGDDTNVDINTALLDLGDAISAGFGIPVKNIRRDVESIYNTVYSTKPLSETSKAGILDSILSKTQFYDNRKTANYGRLVDAYMSGDDEKAADIVDRLLVSGTEESSIVRGTKSVVKTEYLNGRISDEEAIKFLVDHGNADADDAYWLIQEWEYNSAKGDDDPNFSKYMRLRDALDSDDLEKAHEAAVELLEHGVTVRTLKSELSKHAGSSDIIYELDLDEYID